MSDRSSATRFGVECSGAARPARAIAAIIGLLVLLVVGPAAGVARAATFAGAQQSRDVDLRVEAGLDGVIGVGVPVPIRITITSKRAQVVTVEVIGLNEVHDVRVELAADAPTVLDVAQPANPFLRVTVRNSKLRELASRSTPMVPDSTRTAVGVGPSLFSKGVPERSPTIGEIQQASLLALTDELVARPGALDSLSSVVLDAGDLDRLSKSTRDALRSWVWTGGDLVLDVEPRAELPVIGESSTGKTTPIGSGWVRFTGGAAQQGAWSTILEPAPVHTGWSNLGNLGMGDEWLLDSGGLVTVGFIPTWIVAAAVFGSALLGGPIAWFVLRTRRRRLWLWGIAPGLSILVALSLLAAGHSVFTAAEARIFADVDNSIWSGRGRVFSGLKSSTTMELADGVQLIGASPDPVVSNAGQRSTVKIDLPQNSFGALALGGAVVDKSPRLEVTAVALDDGTANVTVTNNSDAEFREVTVAGNSRARDFKSVQPGTSETLPFQMGSELNVFDHVFGGWEKRPFNNLLGRNDPKRGLDLTESRGLVLVTGVMASKVDSTGLKGEGLVNIRAVVPVQPAKGQDGTAALRIDEIGGMSAVQRTQFTQMNLAGQGDEITGSIAGPDPGGLNPDGPVPGGPAPDGGATATTLAPVPAPGGVQPPDYVRLTSQRGRKAQTCGVATNVPNLDVWNGTGWSRLEKIGQPYVDVRQVGFEGKGHEMQDWMIPAVGAGGRLHLRISGWTFPTPPSMLFQCGGHP